jgi:RNA polymerase sigma-70 factor, ECF subfamily
LNDESEKARRFLEHLEPLQAALEAYCRRNLRDPAAVEDVLQNTVANTFRDFHLYAEGTNFRAWIFRYLNLQILAFNRRHERQPTTRLPADATGADSWEQGVTERLFETLHECPEALLDQFGDALAEALNELEQTERSVLLLRAIGEFKYHEIAEILGIPVGTVMSRLSRSRARLRERLVEYGRRHGYLRSDEDEKAE